MPPVAFPEQIDRAEPPPRGRPGEKLIVRGVAVALALGLVGGLVMRPNLEDQPPAKKAATRQVEIPREPEGLDILVAPAPEPVTPIQPPARPSASATATPRTISRSLGRPRGGGDGGGSARSICSGNATGGMQSQPASRTAVATVKVGAPCSRA